jgi:hypothetical protein
MGSIARKVQRPVSDALEKKLLWKPNSTAIIEKTAGAMAATWYEVGRSQGMTSKFKSARAYARANLEKFIPVALQHLLSMLSRSDISEHVKQEIYEAYIERANDPDLKFFDKPKDLN